MPRQTYVVIGQYRGSRLEHVLGHGSLDHCDDIVSEVSRSRIGRLWQTLEVFELSYKAQ